MECWWPRMFPWFAGLTQHDVAFIRQLGDIVGIYSISFPIVVCNLAIYEGGRALASGKVSKALLIEAGVAALVLSAALGYCAWRTTVLRAAAPVDTVRIAVVQGNIQNDEKTESEGTPGGASAQPGTLTSVPLG